MHPGLKTVALLLLSNLFMTYAWYAVWFMRVPVGLDFLWAGLCLLGAVFFTFRAVGVPV